MKKIIVAALIGAFCAGAFAEADPAMLSKLKDKYPSTTFTSVEKTPVAGIYEVVMGKNVAYVDKDARYFLFGSMYDMQTRTDLTAEKREAANKVDFSALPLKDAVVTVRGNGSRKMAVFTDPDCPYCKQLERTLESVDNVTIYTFMFPIDSLHPKARGKAESVWCAKDRSAAWNKMMLEGVAPVAANCDNPVQRTVELAEKLGIRGTPHMIFQNGKVLPGAAAGEKIEAALAAGK